MDTRPTERCPSFGRETRPPKAEMQVPRQQRLKRSFCGLGFHSDQADIFQFFRPRSSTDRTLPSEGRDRGSIPRGDTFSILHAILPIRHHQFSCDRSDRTAPNFSIVDLDDWDERFTAPRDEHFVGLE